jgi:hypothetical protein
MLDPSLFVAFGLVCVLIAVLCLVVAAEVAQSRKFSPKPWRREALETLARWRRAARRQRTAHA